MTIEHDADDGHDGDEGERRMRLAALFEELVGPGSGIRFEAYDGSIAGPEQSVATVLLRSPMALRYIASAPGDLGLARAYVTGHLEVEGDLYAALTALVGNVRQDMTLQEKGHLLRELGVGVLRRPPRPPQEAPPPLRRGRRHSQSRDAAAISHHYDVSNTFYSYVLGPSMAYTCAVFEKAGSTLEEAQAEKFDLVCRKLGLQSGMRLLDVGCGWGGMVRHAAQNYGVRAVGVTLSRQQAEWGQRWIEEEGLSGVAEVRFQDYRDVVEDGFDAVSSIGLTEHIGLANLPSYFTFLASRLREGGRLLNHCITRPTGLEPARAGGFIDRYIFPDGELEGPGTIISAMHDHGFEVRHEESLREHYAMTLREWAANLDAHWAEAVTEVGLPKARVWRLYLVASRVGFDLNKIQLHQVLGVHLGSRTESGMPLRPDW
jgi:cyclopropane-fatty-acyl-phospholipid synthase